MDRVRHIPQLILEVKNWNDNDELDLTPWYQRRSVWTRPMRSYLITTILEALPMPTLYVRRRVDVQASRHIREVVDGQQRLRAILDFMAGEYSIVSSHSKAFGGKRWLDLDESTRELFLNYELSFGILEGATDQDVLDVFARLNAASRTLSPQEKRHAKYFGAFKTFCQDRALERLAFWRRESILSDNEIARMIEIELASELLIGMMEGLQDGKAYLNKAYKKYDDELPRDRKLEREYNRCFDTVAAIGEGRIAGTAFARIPLFYTLFLVVHDLLFGLGDQDPKHPRITKAAHTRLRGAMAELSERIQRPNPAKSDQFLQASTSTTHAIRQRTIRHQVVLKAFLKVLEK